MNLTRGQKLFYGFCIASTFCVYGIVGNYDYEDQVKYERYLMELNARKMWEEKFPHDKRPAMSADPAFVGKPSKHYYEQEYAKLRAKYEKRRRRWEAKE